MRITGLHPMALGMFHAPAGNTGSPSSIGLSAPPYAPNEGTAGGAPGMDTVASASLAGAKTGILKHGEHMADLVLDIVPGIETGKFPGFDQYDAFIRQLMAQIEAREIAVLNEKFDGSPSMVLGFDGDGRPYVAYKHGVGGARGPRIVRTVKEARKVFRGEGMRRIFEDSIRFLRPRLLKFKQRDLVFQADLLFTPSNGAMEVTKNAVRIKANPFGIEYVLPAGSKFYNFAARAKVGLVVHTVGRRIIDAETKEVVGVQPLEDMGAIESLVKTIRSEAVFAIDPWSRRVEIDRGEDTFTVEKRALIEGMLIDMRKDLKSVRPMFRVEWERFLPHFRTFLNASLKEGRSGGIYRAAADGEEFHFGLLAERFHEWLVMRSETMRISPKGAKSMLAPKKMPGEFEDLIDECRDSLKTYFRAYFNANRILYLLKPHMQEAYSSKLGGGQIEGVMISNKTTKVKLVDRLGFTMQNFSGENRRKVGRRAKLAAPKRRNVKPKVQMPQIYRKWRAGAAFFLGKLQPPHIGHIAMLNAAIQEFGAANVFIMPSLKQPNLRADHWKELGLVAGGKKKDLAAGLFTHPFSVNLRDEILRHGLPDDVHVQFADTSTFRRYLNRHRARNREGRVVLLVGQKEIEANEYRDEQQRFADHLIVQPRAMEAGGLNATAVRGAVRMLSEYGDVEAYEFLAAAYAFIKPPKERDRIIGRMLHEWQLAERAAARLL